MLVTRSCTGDAARNGDGESAVGVIYGGERSEEGFGL